MRYPLAGQGWRFRQLGKKTAEELIEAYVASGLAQEDAAMDRDMRRVNRWVKTQWRIQDELQARPGDQRRALLALLDHKNMRVRLNAAKATLAIAPERARRDRSDLEVAAPAGSVPRRDDPVLPGRWDFQADVNLLRLNSQMKRSLTHQSVVDLVDAYVAVALSRRGNRSEFRDTRKCRRAGRTIHLAERGYWALE